MCLISDDESEMNRKKRELLNLIRWTRDQLESIQNESNYQMCDKYQGAMDRMEENVLKYVARKKCPILS